mmetsp:Transcript_35934/g.55195  ORF Transcript_35934/g.55195 Transcript_35934/m.55195 type:complete len:175 (-) Transcript_35934:3033-3557(-)
MPLRPTQSVEEQINKIVFGIGCPPRRYDLLRCGRNQEKITFKPFVKVNLNQYSSLYFKNDYPFELHSTQCENLFVLLSTLSAEIILQLFKRLLFNTCNILVSHNPKRLNKCIHGIIELFYPLSNDFVSIPILPDTMLEYVSMCDHSIIGVVDTQGKEEDSRRRNYFYDANRKLI